MNEGVGMKGRLTATKATATACRGVDSVANIFVAVAAIAANLLLAALAFRRALIFLLWSIAFPSAAAAAASITFASRVTKESQVSCEKWAKM